MNGNKFVLINVAPPPNDVVIKDIAQSVSERNQDNHLVTAQVYFFSFILIPLGGNRTRVQCIFCSSQGGFEPEMVLSFTNKMQNQRLIKLEAVLRRIVPMTKIWILLKRIRKITVMVAHM